MDNFVFMNVSPKKTERAEGEAEKAKPSDIIHFSIFNIYYSLMQQKRFFYETYC